MAQKIALAAGFINLLIAFIVPSGLTRIANLYGNPSHNLNPYLSPLFLVPLLFAALGFIYWNFLKSGAKQKNALSISSVILFAPFVFTYLYLPYATHQITQLMTNIH